MKIQKGLSRRLEKERINKLLKQRAKKGMQNWVKPKSVRNSKKRNSKNQ